MGMRWPWRKVERRQTADPAAGGGGSYTDAIVTAILDVAKGGPGKASPLGTAALEGCAALYAAAFASARVAGDSGLVTAPVLAAVGRDLVRHGEAVFVIYSRPEAMADVQLLRASSWDVTGGIDPGTWRYQVTINGPSGSWTRRLPASSVIHATYATTSDRPWTGVAPLEWASGTGKLLAAVEQVLSDESSGTRGYLLPVPADGQDAEIDQLKADLGGLAGGTSLVETTAAGWGAGGADAPRADWQPRRIGPAFPMPVVQLRGDVERCIAAAAGVPVSLLAGSGAEATAREGWRRFLFGTIAPAAKLLSDELTRKLERPVSLSFDELRASDLQGRARAFKSMVDGGLPMERAAALAGFAD